MKALDFTTPRPGTKRLPSNVGAKGEAMYSFVPPIESEIKPVSNLAVITVGIGAARDMLRFSEEAMRVYARNVGADFIALTNRTQAWPMAEKFRLAKIAKGYKRVLFLDADVFVREDAPNIFEEVPAGAIGLHDDMPDLGTTLRWLETEQRALGESQGVKIARACFNTGVVVFDGADADIWTAPPKPFHPSHCAEQHWVQHQAQEKGRVFSLRSEFNWQYWAHPDFSGVEDAYFVHLAGITQSNPKMALPLMRALCLR